jgi:hypothetical protein
MILRFQTLSVIGGCEKVVLGSPRDSYMTGTCVNYIIRMTSSQDFEKIYPVFAVCTMKGCKKFVADMGQ